VRCERASPWEEVMKALPFHLFTFLDYQ
jgi:hypothetical protein